MKDQKQRQYKADIAEFQRLAKRLSCLPHIQEFTLPETGESVKAPEPAIDIEEPRQTLKW